MRRDITKEHKKLIHEDLKLLKNNLNFNTLKCFFVKHFYNLNINKFAIDNICKKVIESKVDDSKNLKMLDIKLISRKISKEYWISRGWDLETSIKKAKDCCKIYSHSNRLQQQGYTYKEAKLIESKSVKKGKETLKLRPDYETFKKNFIHKPKHYLNKLNTETNKNYTLEEAKIAYSKHQSKAAKLSNVNKTPDKMNTRIEYYLAKGLSEEDAKKALFERQIRNGLNYYINKYGVEDGTKKYNIRIKKFGDKIKKLRRDDPMRWIKSFKSMKFYSDSSKRFFDSVIYDIEELENFNVYYADNEYFIYDKNKKKISFYDFYIKELNLIIEYNGIAWHPKTRLQENWIHPYTKKTSEYYYDHDQYKIALAKENGIEVITVFEDELTNDKPKIINEIRRRINKIKN